MLLVVAGILVYANSFSGVFLLDDLRAIVDNPHIRSLWPLSETLQSPPQSTVSGRPLVSLTLALSYALSGLRPWGYHLINLLIHLCGGLLLFGIVRRTLRLSSGRTVAAAESPGILNGDALALAIALLWVVHPLQTQSVTYIIQRAEALMGLFYLLTLYSFVRSATSARPWAWGILAVVACAAGMLTKEVMASAPIIVFLFDAIFLAGCPRRALRQRGALHAALAATWLVLAVALVSGPRSETAGFGVKEITPFEYARTQPGVILHYLRLVIWPHPLCLDYHWPIARSLDAVILPAALVATLLALTVWALVYRPRIGFLGAAFFLILAPTSSVVPIHDIAFEHRMYLPLAAALALGVLGIRWLLVKIFPVAPVSRDRPGTPAHQVIAIALVALAAVELGGMTFMRNRDYRSALAMWEEVARVRPENPRAHCNIGVVRTQRGDLDGAIAAYSEAVRVEPTHVLANYNLGTALREKGRVNEAERHFREALRGRPDYIEAHINLGSTLVEQGRLDEAIDEFRAALNGQPGGTVPLEQLQVQAYMHLGNALARKNAWNEAIAAYESALQLNPDYYRAHYNLGLVLQQRGRVRDAAEHFRRTLALKPDHEGARRALAASPGVDPAD
jgi:tetratricopeptide (TPR) repeat protein